jgi:hypothetical protein
VNTDAKKSIVEGCNLTASVDKLRNFLHAVVRSLVCEVASVITCGYYL